jgi:hypothetical protein
MPVEIRELIIRAVAVPETRGEGEPAPPGQAAVEDKEALIQECVRQVLRILKKMKER